MGGFGCWHLAARRPELFAAVVPLCGGGNIDNAESLVNVPIWAVHGDQDESVPVDESRKMIDAIRRAGGEPKYLELEGVGHDCRPQAYDDPDGVIAWMFSQVNDRLSPEITETRIQKKNSD